MTTEERIKAVASLICRQNRIDPEGSGAVGDKNPEVNWKIFERNATEFVQLFDCLMAMERQ